MLLRRYHEEKADDKQGVTTLKDITPDSGETFTSKDDSKGVEAPKKATRRKATKE